MFTGLGEIFGFAPKLAKSEWGQISEFLGLVLDLPPVPGRPPFLYLSQFKRDKLETQIYETRKVGSIPSAAFGELVRKLSSARPLTMVRKLSSAHSSLHSAELERGISRTSSLG